ncbi:MAG: alanyl-tRNA editing protein [Trueperaceae bacterium]|nr:alanyl-tRNA editing protein [Trueperaceae bacterium]
MRTDQLDSYLRSLDARVRAVRRDDAGVWLSLSDSVFYPTSGGQPHDTGRLAHEGGVARVVDVVADGPDAVLHRVEGDVPAEGQPVHAQIDWDRRYRHMQRHTAQHLLSQAFLHVDPGFETRSVALTSADATVDVAGEPTDEDVDAAIHLARDWAYRTLPIRSFEIDEDAVSSYPLRRPPKVTGRIRLVEMGEVELSACGGTHLRTTAETLPLLGLGRQRIRGGLTRVTFRAGLEAGRRAQHTVTLADDLARSFSARWDELPARIEALRDEVRAARQEADAALAAWAELRVQQAEAGGRRIAGASLVRIVVSDAASLAALAEASARVAPGALALLAAREADRATLLLQAGPEAPAGTDLRIALKAALPHVEGRGGGKADRVQGAGPAAAGVEAALDAAEAALSDA